MLLATPLEGVALRVGYARLLDDAGRSWWRLLLPVLAGAGLLALGYKQAPAQGWGTILLAAMTIALMFALSTERERATIPGSVALADRKGLAWLMLPLAGFGGWLAGLAGLFAYAAGSFFWAQHHAHHAKRED